MRMSLVLLLLILLLTRLSILVILYSRYTHGHAGVRNMVCETKCHTEQSVTPQHGGGHLLNPWGPPLESSLRLVLGDEDVSGALVIDIITDQIQYSCYIVFPLYARSCWRPAHGVWN